MTTSVAEEQRDIDPGVDQPGLSDLREAVANHVVERLPGRRGLGRDAVAGLNSTLSSVPDGMASGLLAGVNPILGLYACIFGPIAGALFSSTQLMLVVTTSASALGAGQALSGRSGAERAEIMELATEERELWERAGDGDGLDAGQRRRLELIRTELDQCEDLLQQRPARGSASPDPDAAELQPAETVEGSPP